MCKNECAYKGASERLVAVRGDWGGVLAGRLATRTSATNLGGTSPSIGAAESKDVSFQSPMVHVKYIRDNRVAYCRVHLLAVCEGRHGEVGEGGGELQDVRETSCPGTTAV